MLGLFVLLPFAQAVPLPLDWIKILSPERFHWLQQAMAVTGIEPPWTSLSYTPIQTLFAGVWTLFLLGFVLLVLRTFRDEPEWTRSWFFPLLFVIAAGEAGYGILQALIPSLGVLWSKVQAYEGFARGTFINRNHLANFLNLLWPLLLAWIVAGGIGQRAEDSYVVS